MKYLHYCKSSSNLITSAFRAYTTSLAISNPFVLKSRNLFTKDNTSIMESGLKRTQPKWSVPVSENADAHQLKLYNSLTRTSEVFVPKNGNYVKAYICGPTVYDSSHMGHARAYLSFDIVRRVLQEYFGYDVLYVMNITDIDDKIIKRARQNYLFDEYSKKATSFPDFMKDVHLAFDEFKKKLTTEADPDKLNLFRKTADTIQECLTNHKTEEDREVITNACRGILSDWADMQFGSTVNEHSIFEKLSKYFENEFMEDMKSLNVLSPNVLTRVTEYVPEIVEYVEKIIENGYAYTTSDGSVYFNTKAFSDKPNHFYAKLVPEGFDNSVDEAAFIANMKESEGELSMGTEIMQEKKNASDFALWKSSKGGEPFWDSPWGKGRPGWHIECSVMVTAVCGEDLDIHAGGSDLKFPHHDNEIAQCEAYHDCSNWVNYFLHCGTLKIQGCKMSKSLKNFITIRKALEKYTPRQLRILFLMHNWNDVLDYGDQSMERALQLEKSVSEFLMDIQDKLRKKMNDKDGNEIFLKLGSEEMKLLNKFAEIKNDIHSALCNSINTRAVVEKVREIVTASNVYAMECKNVDKNVNCIILRDIAAYIVKLFKMFGAPLNGGHYFENNGSTESNNKSGVDEDEMLLPYLSALANFREKVRLSAIDNKNKDILKLCDELRDVDLFELGIKLEDKDGETVVKRVGREVLLKEREQKEAIDEAKRLKKDKNEKERLEKEAKMKVDPQIMFTIGEYASKFSAYDEKGIPTHTLDGEKLSQAQRKKMEKNWDTQRKKFEQFKGISA